MAGTNPKSDSPQNFQKVADEEPVSSQGSKQTVKQTVSDDDLSWMEALNAYFRGDFPAALKLLVPLAESGHGEAQNFLGNMYHDGDGVERNYREAEKWFRAAAENGVSFARRLCRSEPAQ